MKALILFLLMTASCYCQQVIKDYDYLVFSQNEKPIKEIKEASRIFFNYQDIPGKIKIYLGSVSVFDCKEVRPAIKDKTPLGNKYTGYICTTKDGTLLIIQVFEDPTYGVRLIDRSDLTITLYE